MSTIVYVLIGMLDVFAVFVLALKLYRLPLQEYLFPIMGFCITSSAISYYVRVEFDLPWLDLVILILFLIIFLRFVMKLKLFYAALITGAGLNSYILLQFIVMIGFLTIGGSEHSLMYQSQGIEIQLVQIISIVVAYIIAAVFKMFRYGFSFISVPPHDFLIKTDYSKHTGLSIATATGLIVGSLSLPVLFSISPLLVFPSILISFGLSYYYSNRRDLTID